MSFKSLKVAKNINENSKNKPIRKKPSWVFCFKGLPSIFSNKKNIKWPPSNNGIGNKFMRPRLIDM